MLVTCTNCQSKIKVPDSAAGKKGKCPKCGTIIAIPAADESPAEEAAPEPEPAEQPAGGGSPFDFSDEPPAKKGRKADDDAIEEEAPRKKAKAKAADDEELDEPPDLDDDEKPRKRKDKDEGSIGLPVTALVLGAVSLLSGCGGFGCCCLGPISFCCAIGALICGFLGLNKGGKNGKIMAIIGMSLGGLSLLLALGSIVLALLTGGLQTLLNMAGAR